MRVLVHYWASRRSATILQAEDGVMERVVGDDRNDDRGSNDAAVVVVQHVSMHPTSRGGGEAVVKGRPRRTTDWKHTTTVAAVLTMRMRVASYT